MMKISPSRWPTADRQEGAQPYPKNEIRESALGAALYPRRASEARLRRRPVDGLEAHGTEAKSPLTNIENLPAQPRLRDRVDRSLCSSYDCLCATLRISGSWPRTAAVVAVCSDPASDAGAVGTPNCRGNPLGPRAEIYCPRRRPSLWQRIHTPHPGNGHSGSAHVIPLALAERLGRATDRVDPT